MYRKPFEIQTSELHRATHEVIFKMGASVTELFNDLVLDLGKMAFTNAILIEVRLDEKHQRVHLIFVEESGV